LSYRADRFWVICRLAAALYTIHSHIFINTVCTFYKSVAKVLEKVIRQRKNYAIVCCKRLRINWASITHLYTLKAKSSAMLRICGPDGTRPTRCKAALGRHLKYFFCTANRFANRATQFISL
jgi:hypothetical protein